MGNCEELISRQAAIVQLSHNKTGDDDCDVVIQNDIETIKSLPSAQPEIIRCKDCEHYDAGVCRRWKYAHVTAEDSFCSDADMIEPRLHITESEEDENGRR